MMTTLVQADGTWNVTPSLVGEGTWLAAASVRDPAGNVGSDTQTLTIVAVPAGTGETGATGATGATGDAGATGTTGATGSPGLPGAPGSIGGTGLAGPRPDRPDRHERHRRDGADGVAVVGETQVARGKPVKVSFVLNGPAKVTLTVMRGTKAVATLTTTRLAGGRGALTWNGKVKGRRATRGTYKIRLRAISPLSSMASDSATLRVS